MYKNNSATTDKRPEKHGHTFVSSATTCHAPKWEHSWVPKNVQTFDAFERKHFPVSQNHKDHKLNCCMEFNLCQNHAFGSAWSFLDLKISWHMFFVVVFLHFWQGWLCFTFFCEIPKKCLLVFLWGNIFGHLWCSFLGLLCFRTQELSRQSNHKNLIYGAPRCLLIKLTAFCIFQHLEKLFGTKTKNMHFKFDWLDKLSGSIVAGDVL